MNKYEVGKIVEGTVTGIVDYGVFVTFDDCYSGLIHISELSDGYIENIFDFANINDIISVEILEIDKISRMNLSVKGINNKKKNLYKTKKIKETSQGFKTLKSMLPSWINENINNVDKKVLR